MSRSGTCSLSPFILYWTVLEMTMHFSLSLSLSRPHTLQLTGNCCSPPDGQWVSGVLGALLPGFCVNNLYSGMNLMLKTHEKFSCKWEIGRAHV